MKATSKIMGFIAPQLATLSAAMPTGPGWVHELKFDGYRMIAIIRSGNVSIVSRSGKDWTAAFQSIADMLKTLPVQNAVLDGELVVTDAAGRTSFSELKDAIAAQKMARFQYYVFDLLRLNGEDLCPLPLLTRKSQLYALLQEQTGKAKKHIIYSDHFTDKGPEFFKHVCSLDMEGVVCKKTDAPYTSGRTKTWLKVKCQQRQEFVIGGFTPSTTSRDAVGALLLGYYDGSDLHYAGRVGTGWSHAMGEQLHKQLSELKTAKSPYVSITAEGKRGAVWVKPELVCEIVFSEWTPDDHLRHASFQGLREDKPAKKLLESL
jgi:bifunctional non-homologous end joining protein LigD